jgi:ribosomal protein L28
MIVCGVCGKPTRIGHSTSEVDGKTVKIRVCKKCNGNIDTKSERAAKAEAKAKVVKKKAAKSKE